MKKTIIGLVLVNLLLIASSAQAMLVTHNSTTVFEDDFASDTLNIAPDNPTVGSWHSEVSNSSQVVVTNAALPGASSGSKYLKFYDDGTCNTHALFTDQNITSGILNINYMAYITEDDSTPVFSLSSETVSNGLGQALFWVIASSGGNVSRYDGSVHDTGVDWKIGVWQEWEFDVNLDTGKFTLSVDGSKSSVMNLWRPSNIAKNFIVRGGKGGETFYVDAVPEPAAFSLLTLGGLAGLIRRRRK